MKTAFCVGIVLLCLLCGCTDGAEVLDGGVFSYAEDCAYYKEEAAMKLSGFVNTVKAECKDAEQAIALAKKECTVAFDTVCVAYDARQKMYRVSFFKRDWLGGNQDVYINEDGITQRILYGE